MISRGTTGGWRGIFIEKKIFDLNSKWNLVASPDGAMVAVGAMPQTTRLYRTKDGTLVARLPESRGTPLFSPDGKLVVTQTYHKPNLMVWNTANGALIRTLDGSHDHEIKATAFSPQRSNLILAAGDEGGRITIWDASKWEIIGAIAHKIQGRATAVPVRGLGLCRKWKRDCRWHEFWRGCGLRCHITQERQNSQAIRPHKSCRVFTQYRCIGHLRR